MLDHSAPLPELIADGIRVLVYSGITDFMVNWYGSQRYLQKLDSVYADEYREASAQDWKVGGKKAGTVQKAGKGFGNVAFVTIDAAGHMVPQDEPENALTMWEKWVRNEELA